MLSALQKDRIRNMQCSFGNRILILSHAGKEDSGIDQESSSAVWSQVLHRQWHVYYGNGCKKLGTLFAKTV